MINYLIVMLKHTLLLIYRNSKRHKGTFLINMIGLSTGLACATLIYMWVNDELSVDRFHEGGDRLVQVMQNIPRGNGVETLHVFTDKNKIALLTVMIQALKAARINPVHVLQYE